MGNTFFIVGMHADRRTDSPQGLLVRSPSCVLRGQTIATLIIKISRSPYSPVGFLYHYYESTHTRLASLL